MADPTRSLLRLPSPSMTSVSSTPMSKLQTYSTTKAFRPTSVEAKSSNTLCLPVNVAFLSTSPQTRRSVVPRSTRKDPLHAIVGERLQCRRVARMRHCATRCQAGEGGDKETSRDGTPAVAVKEEESAKESPPASTSDSSKTSDSPSGPSDPTESSSSSDSKNVQFQSFNVMDLSAVEMLGPEKVDKDDVKRVRSNVFGYTSFWVTGQEPFGDSGEGVLFIGNLRANREEVFSRLQKGLAEEMGEKYDLFMLEEPNAEEEDPRGGPRVSFLMLRKSVSAGTPTTVWQYVIATILAIVTAGACLELGLASQIRNLPPEILSYFTAPNPEDLEPPPLESLVPFVEAALPLAYGVFGVQFFHELGHRLVASQRKVKMGIPFLIPNITVGSFGAITQFKSVVPDRTAKFDISVSGPVFGAVLSSLMFGVGLLLSTPEGGGDGQLVQVPAQLFQGSLLLGAISEAVLGREALHAATVQIHPLLIAGWCGLTTSAFNLLPVGCIDGGRAMQAAYGRTALNISGLLTYLLLGLGVLGGTLSLPWGLYILIAQRSPEKPALNNVSEVGTARKVGLAGLLLVSVVTLLPIWESLAEDLGIGLGSSML